LFSVFSVLKHQGFNAENAGLNTEGH
jgi:hypothetical protein